MHEPSIIDARFRLLVIETLQLDGLAGWRHQPFGVWSIIDHLWKFALMVGCRKVQFNSPL
jgi:hypothetical protein